jgi:hypothetical protein
VANFRHFVKNILEKGMQVPCCFGKKKKNRQKNIFLIKKIIPKSPQLPTQHEYIKVRALRFSTFIFSNITKLGRQIHLWKSQLKKNKKKKIT